MITSLFRFKTLVLIFFFFRSMSAVAQDEIIQQYLKLAFKNNIALQQKNIALDKAMYSLKIAKSLYQPTIELQSGFQTGEGGRSISIPIGDIINPVYATLNQLTASNKFPQIGNAENYFQPHNFIDAKIATTVPIYNKTIEFNQQLQQQQYQLQKIDIEAYKRELVKDIKVAYYNFLLANQTLKIYQNALVVASEGKRVNEKLLMNGKGLPAYVLRSESEIQNISAQLNEAEKQIDNARQYFNFLLNRNLNEKIDTSFDSEILFKNIQKRFDEEPSINGREELKMLKQVVEINNTILKMNQSFWVPKINGFLNGGTQASAFEINKKSFYYFGGVQLDFPIFSGKRNLYKIKQTSLDIENSNKTFELTQQQLNLSVQVAKNNLSKFLVNHHASIKQLEAAQSYQRLLDKGYKEGINTFIETLDARNQLTNAQLLVVLNQFKVLIAAAGLERETASFDLTTIK